MLALREVTGDDIDIIYRWANDPVTRQNAFNSDQIPYETHKAWFAKMLADKDVVAFILEDEGVAVGQIRYNLDGDTALISYSIDAGQRGQGLGTSIVRLGEEKLINMLSKDISLIAQVKKSNVPSMKVFENCRYEKRELPDYMEYTRRI